MLADPGPSQNPLGTIGTFPLDPGLTSRGGGSQWGTTALSQVHDLALDLPAELEWIGDVRKRLLGAAGARDGDGPKAQHPSQNSLVDADRLDLAEQGFQGLSLDESELGHHALVGDGELRAGIANG